MKSAFVLNICPTGRISGVCKRFQSPEHQNVHHFKCSGAPGQTLESRLGNAMVMPSFSDCLPF